MHALKDMERGLLRIHTCGMAVESGISAQIVAVDIVLMGKKNSTYAAHGRMIADARGLGREKV